MIDPPRWTAEQLEAERVRAIEDFRHERLDEPLEAYLHAFDGYQGDVAALLESTLDLRKLDESALDVLTDSALLDAFRYVAGPPISADDLKTLADAASLSARKLRQNPDLTRRVIEVILTAVDRRRFPWLSENRSRTKVERQAAAAKAEVWRSDFGARNIVPAAVLSGVYKLHNLIEAQDRGLTLFWAHDLQALTRWIDSTR